MRCCRPSSKLFGWGVESSRRPWSRALPHAIVNDYPQAARDPHVAEVDEVYKHWRDCRIAVRKRPGNVSLGADDRAQIPVLTAIG